MENENGNPVIGRRQLKLTRESIISKEINEDRNQLEGIRSDIIPSSKKCKITGSVDTSKKMYFSRSPRDLIPFPKTKIVVQSPGEQITPPSTSLVTQLLPLAGALIGVVISAVALSSQPAILLVSLPMIGFSIAGFLLTSKRDKTNYQEKTSQRDQLYHAYLNKQRQVLDQSVGEQRRASLTPNPDLTECLSRVENRSLHLWERKPSDPDFLEIRLGTGTLPCTFDITSPSLAQVTQEPDELFKEACALVDSYRIIDNLAINLPLNKVVTTGVIGPRHQQIEAIRAMLMQLTCHHAPNEVKVVLIIPEEEIKDWGWARWLPHTWSNDHLTRYIGSTSVSTHRILTTLEQQLKLRKNQLGQALTAVTPSPAFVFIFANQKVWKGGESFAYAPLLELIIKEGAALGAYSVFLGDTQAPKDSGAIITLDSQQSTLKLFGLTPVVREFQCDSAHAQLADQYSRSLASINLEIGGESASDLPGVIPLLQMLNVNKVDGLSIPDRWANSRLNRSLSVPIGIRSGGKTLVLDLHERAHGPHGLLAGTSGSGKSELLQTLIASLSLQFSPEKVAFILVDFKALMVPPFEHLPHQVGIITNLEGNLAVRALIGLEAEKERRQRLFLQVGKSSIDDYQELYFQGKAPEPLPHLIIIVDEFAELAVDQPDFIQGLVSLSRVGRSLGIHLLLATQKPAGVINETIWANARTRLCLRVERSEDSQEVLKRPDAATISVQQKGRAYLQVGMNEIFEQFQVAWATAPFESETGLKKMVIASLIDLDGTTHPLGNSPMSQASETTNQTQLNAIVEQIILTRQQQRDAHPVKLPWLPPLEKVVYLKDHRPASGGWDGQKWQRVDRWMNPFIGEYDDPAGQSRGDLSIPLGRDGNLAIFGAPGSGKTTLLQTIVTSLILDHSPQDLHVYIMDFGGRSFKAFEPLQHIGAIVLPGETERFHRLIQFIRSELDGRKKILESFGGKINEYRIQNPSSPLADIVLILDNYTAFVSTYNEQVGDLARLATEGGSLGMHLIVSTNVVASLPMSLRSNIPLSITLELVDPTEYISVVGRTNGITPTRGVPGRGLIKGTPPLEFQTALAVESLSDFKSFVQSMSGGQFAGSAHLIPPKEDVVPLRKILVTESVWGKPQTGSYRTPVGIDLSTPELDTFNVDLSQGPHFWIAGPPSTGKTTLLQTWLISLAERYSPKYIDFVFVDLGCTNNLSAPGNLPHTQSCLVSGEQFEKKMIEINSLLEQRAQELKLRINVPGQTIDHNSNLEYPALVMAIEGLDQLRQESSNESRILLHNLMRRKGLGFHVIATGSCQDFSSYNSADSIGNVFKELQTGFLVGYNNYDDLQYVPLKLSPLDSQSYLSAGMAFFVQRGGRYRTIQIASMHHGKPTIEDWCREISKKTEPK